MASWVHIQLAQALVLLLAVLPLVRRRAALPDQWAQSSEPQLEQSQVVWQVKALRRKSIPPLVDNKIGCNVIALD